MVGVEIGNPQQFSDVRVSQMTPTCNLAIEFCFYLLPLIKGTPKNLDGDSQAVRLVVSGLTTSQVALNTSPPDPEATANECRGSVRTCCVISNRERSAVSSFTVYRRLG